MSEPKFKYKQQKDGQWYFTLVAENGEVVAVSEGYATKQGCLTGIASVRRIASLAASEYVGNEKKDS